MRAGKIYRGESQSPGSIFNHSPTLDASSFMYKYCGDNFILVQAFVTKLVVRKT